ncbi:hypothetical protein H0H81_012333 [Sphagnurus paluster]|uniref:Xylanolytic transcriptional activator regulatory domain-containing protein n=1 Tax=Sphagnurus paluster TaxID=117069 RepID=A0A9P7FQH3_9AGAR|nr:hypothetical protein H0H81_012333 [Sphagnurus paluster]
MPAEPTQAKLKRRSSRKDFDDSRFDSAHARELEQKRNRGSLSTGEGTRFVLAATEHLHRRIARLSGRIRQLEDALAALQSNHSAEPHPLLLHDNLTGEAIDGLGMLGGREERGSGAPDGAASDVIDAFGTLSISDHGISRFFGPTGGSESLLIANLNTPNSQTTSPSPRTPSSTTNSLRGSQSPYSPTNPADLGLFSQSFPFTPVGVPSDVQAFIETKLPSWSDAFDLVNTYLAQVGWIFHGVTRTQILVDMLPAIYRRSPQPDGTKKVGLRGHGEDYSGPHDLALLFMILAIGALVRPEPEPTKANSNPSQLQASNNALGENYLQIARAALALQPVLEKPSLVTIQTLHLMSIYNAMSGRDLGSETSMEMTWSLITLAAHLSQTVVDRDSARWGLSPKMVQRRRILFWDLFVADVWQVRGRLHVAVLTD